MTRSFSNGEKRFSIDDAFEEETDEAIKVYGATGDRSPLQNKFKNGAEYIPRYISVTFLRNNLLKTQPNLLELKPEKLVVKKFSLCQNVSIFMTFSAI